MIVTCALDNRKSFANLKKWIYSIKENNSNEKLPIVIIANKCDVELSNREITKEDIHCFAKEWGVEYFETSAKDGTNVDESFEFLFNMIYKTIYTKNEGFKIEISESQNLNENNNGKNICCK